MSEANSDTEDQLLNWFRQLPEAEQGTVLAFAQFMVQRGSGLPLPTVPAAAPAAPEPVPDPEDIPRPDEEKVVLALKRLSMTYFMLDKSKMLGLTSGLMTEHIMGGREAKEVIDELEEVFRSQYAELKETDRE